MVKKVGGLPVQTGDKRQTGPFKRTKVGRECGVKRGFLEERTVKLRCEGLVQSGVACAEEPVNDIE